MKVGGGVASGGIMHGEGVGVAVGSCVGGVGRVVGASVRGWLLRELNVAVARWAFRVGGASRLRRARATFLSWLAIPWRRAMLRSCLTDSVYLEALQL
jgi:hypothetical protein